MVAPRNRGDFNDRLSAKSSGHLVFQIDFLYNTRAAKARFFIFSGEGERLMSILGDKIKPFKLREAFLAQYKGQQPAFGPLGYFTFKRCVDIDTPVLCADFIWRKAGELKEGQEVISFDEDPIKVNRFKYRYLRLGKVTHNKTEDAEVMGIELSDGTIIYATPDHSWLVKFEGNNREYWRETRDLLKNSTDCYLLRPFGPVWTQDNTYDAGYLAGALDGESNLDRTNSIAFIQVDNSMLRQVEDLLTKMSIQYHKGVKKNYGNISKKTCYSIRINGIKNIIRMMGILRPLNLVDKFQVMFRKITAKERGQIFRCKPEDYVRVVRIFNAGVRKIAVLSTDVKTHFTGGFASHNTYARELFDGTTEEFWQMAQRVVEGSFTILKWHYDQVGLPWDEDRWMPEAEQMFRKIWELKFLPAGRGMWLMGTDFMYEHGSAGLCSCAFVSTKHIDKEFAEPFCWAMEASTLGIGCGFDVDGSKKDMIVKKPDSYNHVVHVVEDSREGWVDSLRVLLNAYLKGSYLPRYDYSKIRPKGTPLKSFGGRASGPGPLITMHEDLVAMLDASIGKPLDSEHIADIFNMIGRCIVSGNIRRCLPEYSLVHCRDGLKMIKDVKVGEEVLTTTGYQKVLNVFDQGEQDTIFIQTQDGLLECTENHRIAVLNSVNTYTWVEARNLKVGDQMISSKGIESSDCNSTADVLCPSKVLSISKGNANVKTYDLEVETNEFFADGYLVHNSAQIALSDPTDDKFMRLKEDKEKSIAYRWASNNTIKVPLNNGDNKALYEKVVDLNLAGTDVGLVFMDLIRTRGRLIDGFDDDDAFADGINPCQPADALIFDGDRMRYITDQGAKNWTSWKTGEKEVLELTTNTGLKIRCTPDHKVMLKDGSWCKAKDTLGKTLVDTTGYHFFKMLYPDGLHVEIKDEFVELGKTYFDNAPLVDIKLAPLENVYSFLRGLVLAYGNLDKKTLTIVCPSNKIASDIQILFGMLPIQAIAKDNILTIKELYQIRCLTDNRKFYPSDHTKVVSRYVDTIVENIRSLGIMEVWDYRMNEGPNYTYCQGTVLHNCGEQALESYEVCNLVETYPYKHRDIEDYKETLRYAYLYGKIVTLLPTHWKRTNAVMARNRRIGISQSGIIEAMGSIFKEHHSDKLDDAYKHLRRLDTLYSHEFIVNRSIRLTTVKPSGTNSLLAGCSPGIHYPHSEYYLRRVRVSDNSHLLPPIRESGFPVEPDIYSPNTMVVSFPVQSVNFSKCKDEITVDEQFSHVRTYQTYWSDNQVSVTITFKPEDKDALTNALSLYEGRFKSVSFLVDGDVYAQAPLEAITAEEYSRLMSDIKPLDLSSVRTGGGGVLYCTNDKCELKL